MPPRPNILLITVHDLGTRLGCYGETSVQTPALDRLAAHGVRFVNHFATAPYCSPSRGGIITGKYPHVNGLMGLVNLGWNLPPSNLTLDQALGHAGYETLLFGHQHEVKDAAQLGFQHLPDRSAGVRCGPVAAQVAEFLARRREERPFYARVGFGEVHRPYESYPADDPARVRVPPHLKDTPGARQDLAMFHGCIRTMDAAVGRILDALGSSGLAENTLVVFTTDHGIAFPRAKATLYDPGIRTTLLLRGPGIRPGQVASELISNVDVFPSLLDAAGAPVPGDLNGRSFWPLLTGRAYTPRDAIFAEKNTQPWDIKRCIRTARYKYIRNFNEGPLLSLPTDIESSLTRRDMGHDHLRPRPPVELYDLSADPNEQTNLAGRPDYASVEQDLSTQLQRLLEATHDPILRGPIPRPPDEEQIYRRVWAKLGLPLPKEWDADSRG